MMHVQTLGGGDPARCGAKGDWSKWTNQVTSSLQTLQNEMLRASD